jgi:hypothetical protein
VEGPPKKYARPKASQKYVRPQGHQPQLQTEGRGDRPFPCWEFWEAELPSSISLAIGILQGIYNFNHLPTLPSDPELATQTEKATHGNVSGCAVLRLASTGAATRETESSDWTGAQQSVKSSAAGCSGAAGADKSEPSICFPSPPLPPRTAHKL